jgi:hypothetical protein
VDEYASGTRGSSPASPVSSASASAETSTSYGTPHDVALGLVERRAGHRVAGPADPLAGATRPVEGLEVAGNRLWLAVTEQFCVGSGRVVRVG